MRKSTIFGLTAGLALSAGIVFAAQSYSGSLATQADEAEVSCTLSPAAGEVSAISTITLTFDGKVGIDDSVRPAPVILENTTTGAQYFCYTPFWENASDKSATNSIYTLQFFDMLGDAPVTITEVGEYVLSIRGAYNDETVDENGDEVKSYLPVITANYSIVFPVDYTITPAAGSTVNEISTISIAFDGMVGFEDVRPAVATLESNTTGEMWYCENPDVNRDENGKNVLTLTFSDLGNSEPVTISTPGDYTLSVRGLYSSILNGDDETKTPLPAITANYTIAYPVNYTLDPAAGSNVTSLSTINITFEGRVLIDDMVHPAPVILENKTTGSLYFCYTPYSPDIDNKAATSTKYTLTFYDMGGEEPVEINEEGEYLLTILGIYNGVTIDEDGDEVKSYLAPLNVKYQIVYPIEYTLSPESGSTVSDLSKVVLTFPANMVAYYDNVRPAIATLENITTGESWYSDTELQSYPFVDEETGSNGVQFTISFYSLGDSEVANITSEGDYVLSIRGLYTGTLDEDGEIKETTDLPVITANYSIVYPVKYTLDPSNGSTVNSLSKVVLTFPENMVGYYEGTTPAIATLENTTTGNAWYSESDLQVDYLMNEEGGDNGVQYTIAFYEKGSDEVANITEVGDYVLSIRGLYTGTFDEDGEIKDTTDLPVIVANYQVVYPVSYTISPADDSVVSAINAINVTFDTGSNVGFYNDVTPAVGILENTTTGDMWYCEMPTGPTFDEDGYKTWQFVFTEYGSDEEVVISANGEYLFTIRGVYTTTIDEEGNESEKTDLPNITAKYTIQYPVAYEFTPEDGSEVEEISEIVLSFYGNPNVGIYSDVRPGPAILENLSTDDVWYCENPMKYNAADGSAQFSLTFAELGSSIAETLTDEGEYLLTVKGIYTSSIDEEGNETEPFDLPNITANFFVTNGTTGVSEFIKADSYNVFGINGVQMLNNGKASDLNSLAPGLYIINGKKVLIRK